MKAYRLHGVGDLRYETMDVPEIKPGWVLLEVKAAGICGSDIPRIYETGTYHFPTVPGHEFSGRVVKICAEEQSEAAASFMGKRAGVFPLIPCRRCPDCLDEHYEMCADYDYLGSRRDGGFAQYVAVPAWNLIELPQQISYEEAAMLEPAAVARHAILRIPREKRTGTIAIFGAGTIGLLVAQWAHRTGFEKVILIANKPEQTALAVKLGLTDCCDSSREDPVTYILEQTDGRGADVTVDSVGSSGVREQCILTTRGNGTLLLIGNPKGESVLPKAVYWKILRRQLALYGTWNSSFGTGRQDDWKDCLKAIEEGKIRLEPLMSHVLPFDKLTDGLEIMRDKKEYYCKIMIRQQ